jgi:DNA-directed RNA polymerase specialized sigma24 family protein
MHGVKNLAVLTPVVVDVRNTTVSADVAGLEQVYEEHGGKLWRALFLYTGDREIASDGLAEAFAQALRRGDELRSPERWVWRSAFRIAAGELSRRRRESDDLLDTSYEVPEETTSTAPSTPHPQVISTRTTVCTADTQTELDLGSSTASWK